MSRKTRVCRAVPVAALAVLIAAGLMACSGSGPSTPTAVEAVSSVTTVVLSQTLDDVEVGGQRLINFSLPRRGALTLTVRWNDQSNSVVAALSGTSCFNSPNPTPADGCQVRRSIDRQGREGREGVIDHANAAGAYQLLVENEGPGAESIRVTAELTSTTDPTTPSPYPTDPPRRDRPAPRRSWEP
jgi:hypothetical protein